MDRAEAVRLLPTKYARALTLRDQGCNNARIAAELGIVPEGIGTLLRVAEAKLQQLLDDPPEVNPELRVSLEDPADPPGPEQPLAGLAKDEYPPTQDCSGT
jgi:hypothetical protein